MKKAGLLLVFICQALGSNVFAQEENPLKLSGELFTDERFLLKDENDWVWNENRLSLKLEKRMAGSSRFYSEIWVRNFGLPRVYSLSDLYNKGNTDPLDIEIREAYLQVTGFLTKNLDLTVGRQRIAWGTADKLNPTDNLNPYDMEDILDFGRHRASDAISLNYYISNEFSVQGVYIPFFRPANLPAGAFSGLLASPAELPGNMVLAAFSDSLIMPAFNLAESSAAGFKMKGYAGGFDFSLSYVWGYDGIPYASCNRFIPVGLQGQTTVLTSLSFMRNHIFGVDLATSIAGFGLWAEAAAFVPEKDMVMRNDLSAFYPMSPVPVVEDTLMISKNKPWVKFIIGGDYNFADGSYLNIQYLHGFIHERGSAELNDYFLMQYEKRFFNDKLKVAPLSGAFIISDWDNVADNYAIAYIPQISYFATADIEMNLSAAVFGGKGKGLFTSLKDMDMFMLKVRYSF